MQLKNPDGRGRGLWENRETITVADLPSTGLLQLAFERHVIVEGDYDITFFDPGFRHLTVQWRVFPDLREEIRNR
jgi:hypothetical protein